MLVDGRIVLHVAGYRISYARLKVTLEPTSQSSKETIGKAHLIVSRLLIPVFYQ